MASILDLDPEQLDSPNAAAKAPTAPAARKSLLDADPESLDGEQAAPQQDTSAWEKFKNFAGAAGSAGANAVTMGWLPDVMDKRAELVGGETGDEFKARAAEAAQKSPMGAAAGNIVGSTLPGSGFGKLGGLATKLGNNPLTRVGGAMAGSYAQGLMSKAPEGVSQTENASDQAQTAGLVAGGLEALLGAAKVGKAGFKAAGKALSGLTNKEANAYVQTPELAEELARMNREDPMGLSKRVRSTVGGDLDEAYNNVSKPALEKMEAEAAKVGPQSVSRADVAGSVVEPDYSRMQGVETPDVRMDGRKLLELSRKARSKAFENQRNVLNPQSYDASSDVDAIAGHKLKGMLKAQNPNIQPLDEITSEAARYSDVAKQSLKQNPAQILTDSESLGSVPMRSMRQFLDKNGGSDLESMAQALGAGRAMTDPNRSKGFLHENVGRPVGRMLLKNASRKVETPKDDSLANILASILSKKGE